MTNEQITIALIAALLVVDVAHLWIVASGRKKQKKEEESLTTGLTALTVAIAALTTAVNAVDADVKKLLANSNPGPGPGQVIVNQADIDALTASISTATGVLAADDTAVNPPAPAA